MDQYKYIKYKSICTTTWHFGTTPYDHNKSQIIENAINGIMDNLNKYNKNRNIIDLLYYNGQQTVLHVIDLQAKTVLDMSTMHKYYLH